MRGDNLSIDARIEATEILLRHLFGMRGPIERQNLRTLVDTDATAAEAAALRSGDVHAQGRAAEVRAALERLTG